jgi:hypothetical protein
LALEVIDTGWKCFVKFDVVENTVAVLSSIEHVVCRVQEKVKQQQITLMDMRKK